MGKIIFVIGGARSGKSRFAAEIAKKSKCKTAFIATCEALDNEMKKRISLHKKNRPSSWRTIDEPLDLFSAVKKAKNADCIIIDCLTLWVSNLMLKNKTEPAIIKEINSITGHLKKIPGKSIIVSNEVGLGIVPDNKLARDFRDIAGRLNQLFAEKADQVFMMHAGIPLQLK